MTRVRIGFLTRRFKPETRSSVPLVMQGLAEAGAIVDVVHPVAGMSDLSELRVQHELYVLKQMSGVALSVAGALHAQGATIVNPYPLTLALADKIVAFRILQRAGAPTPETYVTSHLDSFAPLLETGPLIVKPVRGWDGHGVRIIATASELADLPPGKEPLFAQRYIPPHGPELKMFSIGSRVFGVKTEVQRGAKPGHQREPFTPTPELRRIVLRCGEAFGIDLGDKATARRRRHGTDARTCLATLKARLEPYGFADAIALFPLGDEPLPLDLTEGCLDLDAAAEADLLLNLWHSLPAPVVGRFRRSALVDTDPGLLQIWMTTGELQVAPHDIYFTVGETVGTPAAEFPDCGLTWHYTPPPVLLPE